MHSEPMHPLEIMAKAVSDYKADQITGDQMKAILREQMNTPEMESVLGDIINEIADRPYIDPDSPQPSSPPLNIQSLDILTVKSGVIAHQVNLRGVMGAGLALQIKNKWPQIYQSYVRRINDGNFHLGMIQVLPVSDNLWVCNMAGQDNFGVDRCQSDYGAFRMALGKLKVWADSKNLQVYLPYKIGCGLAGGDWSIVSQIIHDELPSAIICQLEQV